MYRFGSPLEDRPSFPYTTYRLQHNLDPWITLLSSTKQQTLSKQNSPARVPVTIGSTSKFAGGDDTAGPREARAWLEKLNVDEQIIAHVCEIIKDISFKGAGVHSSMKTTEGMVVQDADRLDALGAIGIARAFAYGGLKGSELHNPGIAPGLHASFEEYKKGRGTTINHFYEKLLLLKDMMNTTTGKQLADQRHEYMKTFLDQFYREWEGRS